MKKRVVHLGKYIPPVLGGMETSIFLLCKALSEFYRLILIGSHTESKREETDVNPNFHCIRLDRSAVVASTPINLGIFFEIPKTNADLIHLHHPNPWMSLAILFTRKPIVVTYHCDIVRHQLLHRLYLPVIRRVLKKAVKIIATSRSLVNSSPLLQEFIPKVEVIHLSIEEERFQALDQHRIAVLKQKYGKEMILFVGRLVGYKGLSDLVQAAALSKKGKIVIVGEGPDRARIEGMIKDLRLQDKVDMIGPVSDRELGAYLSASRAVILPSVNNAEALGICLIEGLYFSRPLITTILQTGVREVNVAGQTGLEVPVGSPIDLARAIDTMIADDNLWSQFSQNARAHYEKNFSKDQIARGYLQIYQRILGS